MDTKETVENQQIRYDGSSIQFTEQLGFNILYLKKVLEINGKETYPIETQDLTVLVQEAALERMRDVFTTRHNLTTNKGYVLEPQDLQLLIDKFYRTDTIIFGIDKKKKNNDLAVRFDNLEYARRFFEFYISGGLFRSENIKRQLGKPRLYYGLVHEPEKALGKIPRNERITGLKLRRAARQFLSINCLQEDLLRIRIADLFSEFYFLTKVGESKRALLHYNYKKEEGKHYWDRYQVKKDNDIKEILRKEGNESVLLVVDSSLEEGIEEKIESISAGRNISKVTFSHHET